MQQEYAQLPRILDLAQVRGYDMTELLKYDVVPSPYLVCDEGLMTKPAKSSLVTRKTHEP